MHVVPVPCPTGEANYAYLVIEGDRAAVVDPSLAAPVRDALAREGATLAAIWLTHHHWDHVDGVVELAGDGIEVIAGARDAAKIAGVTRGVGEGDRVALGAIAARIVENPGHTLGAISFVIGDAVFTGDTLFGAGCGRVYEGDAVMMHASLAKLVALPPETRVYFGHEYTATNLRFAAAVEPDNPAIAERARALQVPTPGGTIALERATNPFVRTAVPAVAAAAKAHGATGDSGPELFHALREWKNGFK